MPPVLINALAAIAVLALFLAGLFIPGRIGGLLLLLTVAILITLTTLLWPRIRRQGRPLRIIIIAAVGVAAIVKLVVG
jgi:hypothetical protein